MDTFADMKKEIDAIYKQFAVAKEAEDEGMADELVKKGQVSN